MAYSLEDWTENVLVRSSDSERVSKLVDLKAGLLARRLVYLKVSSMEWRLDCMKA